MDCVSGQGPPRRYPRGPLPVSGRLGRGPHLYLFLFCDERCLSSSRYNGFITIHGESLTIRVEMGRMYTVFIIGNIASGKSHASRFLESKGARRIDLDDLAKSLYIPGSAIVDELCQAFGFEILDGQGGIDRSALSSRAFSTPESAARLNAIVHPAVHEQLVLRLLPAHCCSVMVPRHELTCVEISVADAFTSTFSLADEVLAITAPLETRRRRAAVRGMDCDEFDRRSELQPSENDLCALADTVIENAGSSESLERALVSWLHVRGLLQVDPGGIA